MDWKNFTTTSNNYRQSGRKNRVWVEISTKMLTNGTKTKQKNLSWKTDRLSVNYESRTRENWLASDVYDESDEQTSLAYVGSSVSKLTKSIDYAEAIRCPRFSWEILEISRWKASWFQRALKVIFSEWPSQNLETESGGYQISVDYFLLEETLIVLNGWRKAWIVAFFLVEPLAVPWHSQDCPSVSTMPSLVTNESI